MKARPTPATVPSHALRDGRRPRPVGHRPWERRSGLAPMQQAERRNGALDQLLGEDGAGHRRVAAGQFPGHQDIPGDDATQQHLRRLPLYEVAGLRQHQGVHHFEVCSDPDRLPIFEDDAAGDRHRKVRDQLALFEARAGDREPPAALSQTRPPRGGSPIRPAATPSPAPARFRGTRPIRVSAVAIPQLLPTFPATLASTP